MTYGTYHTNFKSRNAKFESTWNKNVYLTTEVAPGFVDIVDVLRFTKRGGVRGSDPSILDTEEMLDLGDEKSSTFKPKERDDNRMVAVYTTY